MYFKNPSQSEIGINKSIEKTIRRVKHYINNGISQSEAVEMAKKESIFTDQVWEYILNQI